MTANYRDLLDPAGLRQGRPCPEDHHQASGSGVRFRKNGQCLGCRLRLPPGLMPVDYPDLPPARETQKHSTAEAAYECHLARVRDYNQRHREQRRAYAREYSRRPYVQEAARARNRARALARKQQSKETHE
jgi:hypothetical protein